MAGGDQLREGTGGVLGTGADAEDLRITTVYDSGTTGTYDVVVTYYTI
jgi:hypothetical protein